MQLSPGPEQLENRRERLPRPGKLPRRLAMAVEVDRGHLRPHEPQAYRPRTGRCLHRTAFADDNFFEEVPLGMRAHAHEALSGPAGPQITFSKWLLWVDRTRLSDDLRCRVTCLLSLHAEWPAAGGNAQREGPAKPQPDCSAPEPAPASNRGEGLQVELRMQAAAGKAARARRRGEAPGASWPGVPCPHRRTSSGPSFFRGLAARVDRRHRRGTALEPSDGRQAEKIEARLGSDLD